MPRFKCTNSECELFEKEVIEAQVKFVFDKEEGKLKPSPPIICKSCKMELENIPTGNLEGFAFNKFDSLSTTDKRKMIHKRSMDHFKKTDKGDLANFKKKIVDDNKRMVRGEL